MIGVYGITVNGMLVYIGKSIDLVSRRKQHWKAIFSAKDGKEKEIKYQCLAAAMDKHFSIEFKIIEECEVDILEDIGLAVPQVTYLVRELRKKGFDISTDVYTIEQAKKELLSILKKLICSSFI